MNHRKLFAAAAIGLSLGLYISIAMAQSAGAGLGVNASGAGVGVNAGAGVNGGDKSLSAATDSNAQQEDQDVSQKIEQAKSQGQDTSAAEKHQKMGERAMNKGNNKSAHQHFEQAEQALGSNAEHDKRGVNY